MKIKSGLVLGAILGISLTVIAPLAYSSSTLTNLSQLSGESVETIEAKLDAGEHPGAIAIAYDVEEAFKELQQDAREANLQRRVDDGKWTQAEADELRSVWNERSEDCTGVPGTNEPIKLERAQGRQAGRNQ